MAAVHTDELAELLARVREAEVPLGFGPDQTDDERAAFRRGRDTAWHMVTFGIGARMAARHPRWDRDRFYDLADGVAQ